MSVNDIETQLGPRVIVVGGFVLAAAALLLLRHLLMIRLRRLAEHPTPGLAQR